MPDLETTAEDPTVLEFKLPSGKTARMRKGKGRDIQRAGRMIDMQKEGPMAIMMAVVAVKTTIDGQPITYEDVLDLDEEDVWALIGKSQTGKASLPSITLAS